MEIVTLPSKETFRDKGKAIEHEYSNDAGRLLTTYVFDNADNKNIPVGERRTLMACSFGRYVMLRRYLTQAFSAFLAVVNHRGNLRSEVVANRNNAALLKILDGTDRDNNDLFIVPVQHRGEKLFPIGGIRFITAKDAHKCQKTGTINLVMGTLVVRTDGRVLDRYDAFPGAEFEPGLGGFAI